MKMWHLKRINKSYEVPCNREKKDLKITQSGKMFYFFHASYCHEMTNFTIETDMSVIPKLCSTNYDQCPYLVCRMHPFPPPILHWVRNVPHEKF